MDDLQAAFDRGFQAVKIYIDAELGALASGVAELARQLEKGDPGDIGYMPPAFAEQIKSMMRLLDESPAIIQRNDEVPVQPVEVVARHVTGSMITREGELAIFYSDGTNERLGSVSGPPGDRGPAGRDGAEGAKGAMGAMGDEGPPGRDGISVTAAAINRDGELMLTLSDGTVLTPGRVQGRGVK